MKKIFTSILLLTFLASCSKEVKIEEAKIQKVEKEIFTVGLKENNFINIYGNVVNSNIKIISPNINGKISYLSCEPGTKISPKTLIASISPNYDGQSYQNSSIQANTLIEQIQKLNELKNITIENFESQKRQISLKKEELNNSKTNISENIGTENSGIKNQIKIVEESIELLKKNQKENEKELENNEKNLKKNIYNSIIKSIKNIDEVFSITGNYKNSTYDLFIGAGNYTQKEETKQKGKQILDYSEKIDENFSGKTNKEILEKLNDFSTFFKNAAQVVKESLAGTSLSQAKIDTLFAEYLTYSDTFISLKNNLEKIENSKESIKINFDLKLKELESKKSSLNSEEKNLKNKEISIFISEKNINEQIVNLEETKKSKLKEIDLQILSAEQNLKSVGITLQSENLYAEVFGTIKTKIIKAEGSQVNIGTQICEIIPEKGALKLEIYSPEKLNIGDKFNFYKDSNQIGTGEIIAEYPERNPKTQNFIYEGKIDFKDLKLGEYLNIKILKKSENDEIWVPLKFVLPKLDGYYVKKISNSGEVKEEKVEIGNMNNGEIKIISGVSKGDILEK